jgi:hypothetical protein
MMGFGWGRSPGELDAFRALVVVVMMMTTMMICGLPTCLLFSSTSV